MYRIKLLNEKHIPYVEAWEIFILEKYTDLIALLSFFVFSIVMIVAPGFSAYLILLSTIIVSNIAIYLVFNISNKLSRKRVFINKENIASKIIEFFSRFFATHYVDVIKIYLETFVGWMVFLLALWAGVSAVYVLSFIDLVGVHVLNSVAVSLPVSYMGYGIREFLLNALMFNNSSDVPYIAVITIQFTIFYIVSVLVGLLLYFYKICFRGSKYE